MATVIKPFCIPIELKADDSLRETVKFLADDVSRARVIL